MPMMRPVHLPWPPLLATAVVMWVVGEPLLARKASIFPPAATTSRPAAGERALEFEGSLVGQPMRLSNYSLGEPAVL